MTGLVYAAGPGTVLSEFEWEARPLTGRRLVLLLEGVANVLEEGTD